MLVSYCFSNILAKKMKITVHSATVMLRMGFDAVELEAFSSSVVVKLMDIVVFYFFLLLWSSLCSCFLNQLFCTAAKRVSAPAFP